MPRWAVIPGDPPVAAIYPMALAWVQARSDTWKEAERSLTTVSIFPGGRAGTGRERS